MRTFAQCSKYFWSDVEEVEIWWYPRQFVAWGWRVQRGFFGWHRGSDDFWFEIPFLTERKMEALHPFGAILSAGTCKGGQGWQAGSTGRGAMVLVLLPVAAQAYLHPSCPGGGLNTAVDLLMGAGGLLQRLGQWAVVGLQAFQVESCLHTTCPDLPADKTCFFRWWEEGGGLASEAFVTITESVWLHVILPLLAFPAGAAVPGAVLSGPSRHSPRGPVSRIRPTQDRNPEAPVGKAFCQHSPVSVPQHTRRVARWGSRQHCFSPQF